MGIAVDFGLADVENRNIATLELPEDNATVGFHNLFQPDLAPAGGLLFQGLRWLSAEQFAERAAVAQTEELLLAAWSSSGPACARRWWCGGAWCGPRSPRRATL